MIDNILFAVDAFVNVDRTTGISNSDLIASQNSQNFVYFGILTLAMGAIGFMFKLVFDRFDKVDKQFEKVDKQFEKVDKQFEKVDKQFEEARDQRHNLEIKLTEIKQALIYTKAAEQNVPPEQVTAQVEAAARTELGLDQEQNS